ncbi:MAG: RnfH family protein [Steroidobacteraceae bacterium]
MKRCTVAYALPDAQWLWPVELADDATAADALAAARDLAARESAALDIEVADVPWDTAPVGVFGVTCARGHVLADGDRLEIYRGLAADPRVRRRERVARERKRSG